MNAFIEDGVNSLIWSFGIICLAHSVTENFFRSFLLNGSSIPLRVLRPREAFLDLFSFRCEVKGLMVRRASIILLVIYVESRLLPVLLYLSNMPSDHSALNFTPF